MSLQLVQAREVARDPADAVVARLPRIGVAVFVLVLAVVPVGLSSASLDAQTPGELGSEGFQEASGEPELGWQGSADLGFTLTEGNSETTSLSVGGQLSHRKRRQRWRFSASHVRASTDGEETANKGDSEAMYDFFPTEPFFLFGKAAAGFNEPAGLDLRLSPGAGVGYLAVANETTELSFEAGGEWTHDEFADGTSDDAARASAAESFSWSISERADLAQSVTYRPDVADFGDYLLDARVSLSTAIVEGLGLKVSFRDQFDSDPFDPATGVEREQNDLTFVTGLTYRF